MASLNWALLTPQLTPLPLPSEKTLLTLGSISLTLFPTPAGSDSAPSPIKGSEIYSNGSVYVSNQRIVFVSSSARENGGSIAGGAASIVQGEGSAGGGEGKKEIQTLSIPFTHYHDGRFVQPWFAATYYEALILPASGGGLEGPHTLRLAFKESGGYQFYEVVEEMKARIGSSNSRIAAVEPLPLYSPPPTSPNTTTDAPTLPLVPNSPIIVEPELSMPPPEDLSAAGVARAEEEREREREAGAGRTASGDAPPGYEV